MAPPRRNAAGPEEEALQFALSFGGAVEVLEPWELRGKVLAAVRAIVARYGFLVTPRDS